MKLGQRARFAVKPQKPGWIVVPAGAANRSALAARARSHRRSEAAV